jgi:hypothetical protein
VNQDEYSRSVAVAIDNLLIGFRGLEAILEAIKNKYCPTDTGETPEQTKILDCALDDLPLRGVYRGRWGRVSDRFVPDPGEPPIRTPRDLLKYPVQVWEAFPGIGWGCSFQMVKLLKSVGITPKEIPIGMRIRFPGEEKKDGLHYSGLRVVQKEDQDHAPELVEGK